MDSNNCIPRYGFSICANMGGRYGGGITTDRDRDFLSRKIKDVSGEQS
jgi:hypothetical protein